MESIRELYKIGKGPSSSHTMGPERIAKEIKSKYPNMNYKAILYGSLAFTGKGHLTDQVIKEVLPNCVVEFSYDKSTEHPNTMDVLVYEGNNLIAEERYYSVGGGSILRKGDQLKEVENIYPHKNFEDMLNYCKKNHLRLYEYVYKYEDENLKDYLQIVWNTMKAAIHKGLHTDGYLPGPLEVKRKARSLLYNKSQKTSIELRLVSAYAYSVSEVNASGGTVVTAPTCGAAGVLPAVLYYLEDIQKYPETAIIDALATAGIVGNVVKHNASISGAEAGCQAEIGTACSMAAAAYSELTNGRLDNIEYAAEIALEHHLGLTCDPVLGYVQIPCIERNAVAAHRAINASELSYLLMGTRKVSFDTVVETMKETGYDLNSNYKETSLGGLAKNFKK